MHHTDSRFHSQQTATLDDTKNKKILLTQGVLCEQEEAVQCITHKGYHLEWAENGNDVLMKLAAGHYFDVIAVDIHVNDMSGLHLAQSIQQDYPVMAKHVVVVIQDSIPYPLAAAFDAAGIKCTVQYALFFKYLEEWVGEEG